MSGDLWDRYREYLFADERLGLRLDVSRMSFTPAFLAEMAPRVARAFTQMEALERGALANPDEKRQVGHYWLRDASRAPSAAIRDAIDQMQARVRSFAAAVHQGTVRAEKPFKKLLLIGIGGSALGPQLVSSALGSQHDRMRVYFLDNTDPDGFDRTLGELEGQLAETLVVVISKSGATKETRNGMLETAAAYRQAGLNFAAHAVAVTGVGSELDQLAAAERWLERFPMWDWVGGRTSEWSAVGLLPAALQGLDYEGLLAGGRAMDEVTRVPVWQRNPAALLALMWFWAGRGRGQKDMVILPYKDRLALFSRYLQQLVMESLGKERDLDGKIVHQGIAVYGNKGSTDQHAYVQQLRDGIDNFFVTFIEVLRDRSGRSLAVEDGATSGDYLFGFLHGTRQALYENGRESITLTIRELTPYSLGLLIALYERAVGLYGSLVNINAYHQPGVEAGKRAASAILELQSRVFGLLHKMAKPCTAAEIAQQLGCPQKVEAIWQLLEHAAANPDHHVVRVAGETPFVASYELSAG